MVNYVFFELASAVSKAAIGTTVQECDATNVSCLFNCPAPKNFFIARNNCLARACVQNVF